MCIHSKEQRRSISILLYLIIVTFLISCGSGSGGGGSSDDGFEDDGNGSSTSCIDNSDCSAESFCINAACSDGASAGIFFKCGTFEENSVTYERLDLNDSTSDGCECTRVEGNADSDNPDLTGEDVNCDGIDGVLSSSLFVSVKHDSTSDGSMSNPYKSINDALSAFEASSKSQILVTEGDYEENIVLTDGIKLYGGYSSDFTERCPTTYRTIISGQEPNFAATPVNGTVNAVGISTETTVIDGFEIRGYRVSTTPASDNGYNSYAIYVLDSNSNLIISNNLILAGQGGNGAKGSDGAQGNDGGDGGDGVDMGGCTSGTCSGVSQSGGSAGVNASCNSASGIAGGSAICPTYEAASYTQTSTAVDGLPGWNWTRDSSTANFSCQEHATEAGFPDDIRKLDGYHGANGNDGSNGLQGSGCSTPLGNYISGHWTGGSGNVGAVGEHGQRGGAGGSSGGLDTAAEAEMPSGITANSNAYYKLGATGGGSGAGGCGGTGGIGGKAGGASIGVFVAWSDPATAQSAPLISANTIQRGLGGKGGDGGQGGLYGQGGDGGSGGDSGTFWIAAQAGDGGNGGNGGYGGGGGGGCGGASFALAIYNYPATWSLSYESDNTYLLEDSVETGGAAGQAGIFGQANPNGDGTKGSSLNYQAVPAN